MQMCSNAIPSYYGMPYIRFDTLVLGSRMWFDISSCKRR